jgi:molybdopterin-guanine dinucleotide biosynthesis protein
MPTVGIAGLASGVGKTQLIEMLLDVFPGASVLKVTVGEHHTVPRIVASRQELMAPGKDTWRYLQAGAGDVVWIPCRREDLGRTLGPALDLLNPGLLLVESNSAIERMDPDIIIFVEGEADARAAGRGSPKDRSLSIRVRADFVTSEPFDNFDIIVDRIKEVIQMSEDKVRELIQEKATDNRLPCAAAFKIAEETGVPRNRVGEILNEMEIKVTTCQLGCFP